MTTILKAQNDWTLLKHTNKWDEVSYEVKYRGNDSEKGSWEFNNYDEAYEKYGAK